MARYRDDGEVQIDNSTKVHFRNAFQQLIMIAALNVGTLLMSPMKSSVVATALAWRQELEAGDIEKG
jgi:hypothetical protein